jgi:uncharacterized membrane protein YqhA
VARHIDSGILKVKVALSIAGITLVQILKDFVNIEKVDWTLEKHRIVIHITALVSALVMAFVWRVTHPSGLVPDSGPSTPQERSMEASKHGDQAPAWICQYK